MSKDTNLLYFYRHFYLLDYFTGRINRSVNSSMVRVKGPKKRVSKHSDFCKHECCTSLHKKTLEAYQVQSPGPSHHQVKAHE